MEPDSMTEGIRASLAILAAALAVAVWYLLVAMPLWLVPSSLLTVIVAAVLLIVARRPFGFSLAQFAMFCGFLIAVAFVVGDPEGPEPWPHDTVISPYIALVALCLVYVACVVVLRREKADLINRHTPSGR